MNDNTWDYLSNRNVKLKTNMRLDSEEWDKRYHFFVNKIIYFLFGFRYPKEIWKSKKRRYYDAIPSFSLKTRDNLVHTCYQLLKSEKERKVSIIPRVVYIITTKCSLRCKACSALTPYYPNGGEFIDSKEIKKDLQNLFDRVNQINVLELIGGEPFIHPDIVELIRFACESEKVKSLELTSNGLFNLTEDIIDVLRNYKIRVYFTYYGKLNRKQLMRKLFILRNNGIVVQVLKRECWFDFGLPQRDKIYGEGIELFNKCYAPGQCDTVYKGGIFPCSAGPYLYEQGMMQNKYIIDNDRNLYNFYTFPQTDGCKYCNVNYAHIEVAEQLAIN